MTDPLIERAEQHDYRALFLHELNWSKPNHPPIAVEYDGRSVTATNVSAYKGLRVWVVNEKPDSKLEAHLDRAIAQTTTDRIVIFHDDIDQVWRWPVRRVTGNATATRLSRHRHRSGDQDPRFADKIASIRLPFDDLLDTNAVLAKVRQAFDVEVQNETKHASKLMARLYAAMEKAYPASTDKNGRDHQISVTLARVLFLMFGDDTDMWQPDLFRDFIHQYTAPDGSDIGDRLTQLFAYLDTVPDERRLTPKGFEDFRYVNGGIFRERITLPSINAEFRSAVLDACDRDWATISPAIFGSMFQSVRDATTRRELGEHYTSEENILKTLNPLLLDELRAELATIEPGSRYEAHRLKELRDKLGRVRYMDPACGCGNFIIVAYRELRDLELTIMERQQVLPSGERTTQFLANEGLAVTLDHFYGIEIDEWPARIAETAMFLVDRQCDLKLTASLGIPIDRLPIQEQATIVVGDALELDWSEVLIPSKYVVVAGNPPFLGISLRSADQTAELQKVWGNGYHGTLDYVTGWHAQALVYFENIDGRWAFVTTNSITQGEAVAPLFGPILDAGWLISFAHRTFRWTSEAVGAAAVHCVIIGFARHPGKPRLFNYETPKSSPVEQPAVPNITPYLTAGPSIIVHPVSKPLNPQLGEVAYGNKPTDGGHLIVEPSDYDTIMADPIAAKYVRPYIGARELLHNGQRHCLWLTEASKGDLATSPVLRQRVAEARAFRAKSKAASTRDAAGTAHLFRQIAQPNTPYLCVPAHVSETRPYFVAARFGPDIVTSNANFLAADPDGFMFAIISSTMFLTWQRTVGGRIKSDLRFNKLLTWNTFPLPPVDPATRSHIIAAADVVLQARAAQPGVPLADMYAPGQMTDALLNAHKALDCEVDQLFDIEPAELGELERQTILFVEYQRLATQSSSRSRDIRR